MIIRNRGYLPHIETQEGIYFVTFRLADSLPKAVLESWKAEREDLVQTARMMNRSLSEHELKRLNYLYLDRIENSLDTGVGNCWLRKPEIAELVSNALKHFDGERYILHAWCVMPNHVHVLFSTKRQSDQRKKDSLLVPILHSWKSFTAKRANEHLGRQGQFWQEEYFDTIVRSERQFAFYIQYILNNPVAARLCTSYKDWPWSGVSREIRLLLEDTDSGQDARAPSEDEHLSR